MLSKLLSRHVWELSHHLLNSRHLQIQQIHMVLGEEAHSQSIVDKAVAVIQLEITAQCFYECGFTSTVGADQCDTGVEVDVDVDFFENVFVGVVANVGFI